MYSSPFPSPAAQEQAIYAANRARNGGRLRDDATGRYLAEPQRSQSGVTPSPHEATVDHVVPKNPADPTVTPGSNSYSNAQVTSRQNDLEKSNK